MDELKKILCNSFGLPEKFSKREVLNLLKDDNDFRIIRYFIDNYNIKKAINLINILYSYAGKNNNTLFFLELINTIPEISNYCEKLFCKNEYIIDLDGNIDIEKISNEFLFNIIYAYAIKNKLVKMDDKTLKENEMVRKIKAGDTDLLNVWLKENSALIYSLASRFYGFGVDKEDLFQEGAIGVIKAIEKYNPDLNYKFSTYAVWWIKQKMVRYIHDNRRTIRIPVHMSEFLNKINKVKKDIEDESDKEVTAEDIALRLNIPVSKVEFALETDSSLISLNTKTDDKESTELGDFVSSTTLTDEEVFKNMKHEEVLKFVSNSTLTKKEKEVIFLRFGLEDGVYRTLKEVGAIYDVSRERIRQIESAALRKLRRNRNRFKVIDFMDCEPIEHYNGKKTSLKENKKYKKRQTKSISTNINTSQTNIKRNGPVIVYKEKTDLKQPAKVKSRTWEDHIKIILENISKSLLFKDKRLEELIKEYSTVEIVIIVLKFGKKLECIKKDYTVEDISNILNLDIDYVRRVCISFLSDVKEKISSMAMYQLDTDNAFIKKLR